MKKEKQLNGAGVRAQMAKRDSEGRLGSWHLGGAGTLEKGLQRALKKTHRDKPSRRLKTGLSALK